MAVEENGARGEGLASMPTARSFRALQPNDLQRCHMAIEAAAEPVAPVAPPAPATAEEAAAAPVADAAAPVADTTEGSWIGRIVALITPFFALAAAWIAGVVTKIIPGVTLDKSQIIALMVAAATSVLTAAWKWLQGWQQHEQNVADLRRSQ